MSSNYISFNYKAGNTFIHRLNPVIKILLIPALNILFFNLSIYFSLVLILLQFGLSFYLKFSIKEQIQDFKPILYYMFLLYLISFISGFFSLCFGQESSSFKICLYQTYNDVIKNPDTAIMLLKLLCVFQCAAIIFKTSTSLQIREGIRSIESFFKRLFHRQSKEYKFTTAVSLFVCFIPIVYKNWNQCKRAWFARGGKKNIRMYITIFPVFFSVGIKQAYNQSRALLIRT